MGILILAANFFIFGTVMTASIITMSFLVLIDLWFKLPFITTDREK